MKKTKKAKPAEYQGEFPQAYARFRQVFDEIYRNTGLEWWTIALDPVDVYADPKDTSNFQRALSITADWRYQHAHIWIFLPQVEKLEDWQLEQACWHEVMHCFLSMLGGRKNSDKEEWTANWLARAFMTWTEHLKEGKS